MATMPTIDFGSRRLEIPGNIQTPNLHTPDSGLVRLNEERHREMTRSLDRISRTALEIADIKDRADERDARYAMQQAENWFNAQWNGTDSVNPQTGERKHIPGVADRTYKEFELDGTDSMRECARLKKEFRDTDIYRNLGGGAKRHFDRQFAIYEGRLDNAAAANHRKLAAQKINEQTEADVLHTTDGVQRMFGADDVTFENSAAWGATQMTRLKLGSLLENGEDIAADGSLRLKDMVFRGGKRFDQLDAAEQKRVREIYDASLKNFRGNRIKALADAASNGQSLGGMSPEQCVDKALEMTFVLNGAGNGFNKETGAKNPGNDGLPLKEQISDAERNQFVAYCEKAAHNLEIYRDRDQSKNAAAIEGDLDKIQWEIAPSVNGSDGSFNADKVLAYNFDTDKYRADLNNAVAARKINPAQAYSLYGRYVKMAKEKEQIHYDLTHPEQFASKSDTTEWVRVKQMIADADRNNTPAAQIEAAVEGIKTKLTGKDYFALWHDARQKRNAEEDRISNQVLSAYLGVSEDAVALATDKTKRGTDKADEAVSTLLGSKNAEYVQSGRWSDPDFTIEDIDETKALVKDYLAKHPGDSEGAKNLISNLVEPASRSARSKAFRDRIIQLRRYERMKGNTGIFNVQRAFGEEDGGTPGEQPAKPPKAVTAPGKAETRRPTRRHN